MNGIKFAQKCVLRCSQVEFGNLVGASRSTVANWISGKTSPTFHHIQAARDEIIKRGLPWNDSWWFDPPQYDLKGRWHARESEDYRPD
jgi:transcriptional regulator with XRE-family HTH domain